jgi:hypothetical protein
MPLIGSEQIDKAGTELIRQWIAEMPPQPEPPARR